MNNLILTKERIKRAERVRQAQLSATRNGMLISYRRSSFEKRQTQSLKEFVAIDS